MYSYSFSYGIKFNFSSFSLRLKVEKNLLTSAKDLHPACQIKCYASTAYVIQFQILTPLSDQIFPNLQEYLSLLKAIFLLRKCDHLVSVVDWVHIAFFILLGFSYESQISKTVVSALYSKLLILT